LLVGQNTRFVAPPQGGAFDLERKRLDRLDGLCRKRFDYRVEPAPAQDRFDG